jgi:hypothetical protein
MHAYELPLDGEDFTLHRIRAAAFFLNGTFSDIFEMFAGSILTHYAVRRIKQSAAK